MAIRRVLLSFAAIALVVAVASPAMAGGGGGGSKSKVNVRVKNFTASEVVFGVSNRSPVTGFRALSGGVAPGYGQVTQFKINKGRFFASDEIETQSLNTGSKKTIYIAIEDGFFEVTDTRF